MLLSCAFPRAYLLNGSRYVGASGTQAEPQVNAQQLLLDRYTSARSAVDDAADFGEGGSNGLS